MKYSIVIVAVTAILGKANPITNKCKLVVGGGKPASDNNNNIAVTTTTIEGAHHTTFVTPNTPVPADNDATKLTSSSKADISAPSAPSATPSDNLTTQKQPPSPPSDNSYESLMVYHHNVYRQAHSVPELTWDATLADYAYQDAKQCRFKDYYLQLGGSYYGSNVATGEVWSGSNTKNVAGAQAVKLWGNEGKNFEWYGLPNVPRGNFGKIGHFTQVVWKATSIVGCSTVECPAGDIGNHKSWLTVCTYRQAGNRAGAYGHNVLPPSGK